MIGQWLEQQNGEVLERISDATQWCAFGFSDGYGAQCLKANAGVPREGDKITNRYDAIAFKYSGSGKLKPVTLATPMFPAPYYWGVVGSLGQVLTFANRGPHVERLRVMIQNRARRILARRALAAHTTESQPVLVET